MAATRLLLLQLLFFLVITSSCTLQQYSAVSAARAPVHHVLSPDFYKVSCPLVDQLVGNVTAARFRDSPSTAPATIRLFFLDCFVEGCDGSILISPSATGVKVERDVEENKNLAPDAFDAVNAAKAAVESKCPGVVSCADILAIAARDFVHLAGGPYYAVKKGRRDSKVSLAGKVQRNLPRANATIDDLLRLFASKGLNASDLVALSGAHTIGFAHCDQFLGRLYDYRGTRQPDPFMDAQLIKALKMSCPHAGGNADIVVPFDVQTPFDFDNAYYGNLEARMGLLATDQALFLDARMRPLVEVFSRDRVRFFQAFAAGMDRMGSIRIKKGKKGEVRKDCSRHNFS